MCFISCCLLFLKCFLFLDKFLCFCDGKFCFVFLWELKVWYFILVLDMLFLWLIGVFLFRLLIGFLFLSNFLLLDLVGGCNLLCVVRDFVVKVDVFVWGLYILEREWILGLDKILRFILKIILKFYYLG